MQGQPREILCKIFSQISWRYRPVLRLVCKDWAFLAKLCFEPDFDSLLQNVLKDGATAETVDWYMKQPFCHVPDNLAMSFCYYGRTDCFHLTRLDPFMGSRYVSLAFKGGHLKTALYLQSYYCLKLNLDEASGWLEEGRKSMPAQDYEACKLYLENVRANLRP